MTRALVSGVIGSAGVAVSRGASGKQERARKHGCKSVKG
jgi:hypothetical protein